MKGSFLFLAFVPLCGLQSAVLFSDLGTGTTVYSKTASWTVSGALGTTGKSFTEAMLFTVAGSGAQAVGQIDLALLNSSGFKTFAASILTDNSGTPGTQVTGASWILSTTLTAGTCCGLVTISGISTVTLTGGTQYFMVLEPVSLADNSENEWAYNTQGITGDSQFSNNLGVSWTDNGNSTTLAAFDVLNAPEPDSLLLLGSALIAIVTLRRALSKIGRCGTCEPGLPVIYAWPSSAGPPSARNTSTAS